MNDKVLTVKTAVGDVPVYKFIEKFLKITDKDGNVVPFILNDAQRRLYEEMCKQRQAGEPVRVNILKARQLGFSTFIAAIIFVEAIFNSNQNAVIMADSSTNASKLFEKYKFFYDNLPKELQFPLVRSNARELCVQHSRESKSSIRILVQGESTGRGSTNQFLHLSECAFWSELTTTLTSLLKTVSKTNINSMIFLETTANGFNEYKDRWDRDASGKTNFKPLFFPWYESKDYKLKYTGFDLLQHEEDLVAKYHLSMEQIARYRSEYLDLEENLSLLRQEDPSSPSEAFRTSGNTVFNGELLSRRKEELIKKRRVDSTTPLDENSYWLGFYSSKRTYSQDGNLIEIKDVKFIDSKNGDISIYQEPIAGHPYCVNCDPAMGGNDYFAIQVVDNYTLKQVAVYHRNKCDIDDVATTLVILGRYYNGALISSETNTTSYLLDFASKCGYKKIYKDQDVEDLSNRFANKFGYKTKQNNRQWMIDKFKISFREDYTFINDYETLCEMETFQVIEHKNGNEKVEATSGSHDDLVMAMCGIFLIRDKQRAYVLSQSNVEKSEKLASVFKDKKNQAQSNSYERFSGIKW